MNQEASPNNTLGNREEDIETIVELVWLDFQGEITRDTVRQTVSSVYEEYDEARVRSFLPILIQRRAKELLLQDSSGGNSTNRGKQNV